MKKEVYMTDVRHITGHGREIYARLYDAKSRELLIAATLEYILDNIEKYEYVLIKKPT